MYTELLTIVYELAVPRINLIKISHLQMNIYVINADVALYSPLWWKWWTKQKVTKLDGAKRDSSEMCSEIEIEQLLLSIENR